MARRRAVSGLWALSLLGGAVGAGAQDLCAGLVTDKVAHPMTPLAKPGVGQAVTDPQFGTSIRRISAAGGGGVIKPMYSTISAWNADESRLILYQVGSGHRLYDGRTYQFIRNLDITPADIEQVYWHTSDPDILYYVDANRFIRYHVSTGVKDTLTTFAFCTAASGGSDPMYTSWDSGRIGLECGSERFIYDIPSNTVIGQKTMATGAPQASASGSLAFFDGMVSDTGLNVLRTLDLGNPAEHASLGRLASGRDTYNGVAFDPGPLGSDVGSLVTFDMTDGSWRVIVGQATGYPYPPGGTHVSALAYKRPGWVSLSIVGNTSGAGVLDQEIVLADTNAGGKVCRVAHHRSFASIGYFGEPHAVPSPSGTRILFGSDWGNSGSVDAYVVELPSYNPLGLMRVKSGRYQGNGTAGKAVYVGFRPDAVFVKRVGGAPDVNAVLRTTTMPTGNSKSLENDGIALAPNLVQSLDTNGFTVGSDTKVNEGPGAPCAAGCDYYWVAFKAAAGEMVVGTYGGDGSPTQSIAGVGFQPEYLIVMPEGAGDPNGMPVWTSSTFPPDVCWDFDATGRGPNVIRALEPDGFQVGNGGVGPNRPNLNAAGVAYHYVAWNAVPGRMAVGTYPGNGADPRNLDVAGFFPEWVLVKKDATGAAEKAVTHKPASTGTTTDLALRFAEIPPLSDTIQGLRSLGFEVGADERVNSATACSGPCTYHWVAFGPHVPQINYRSIGTAADLTNQGTLTLTAGSTSVSKTGGSGWKAANRGRGDRLSVGTDHYMIARVDSDDQLTLASPAITSFTGSTYTIARQFTTLQGWNACVSRSAANTCKRPADTQEYFPTTSASLVADDRSEVGIAYRESKFIPPAVGQNILLLGDTTTDATHTITLTADSGNRHSGVAWDEIAFPGTPPHVVLDNQGNTVDAVVIRDEFVTLEWLEIKGFGGTNHAIESQSIGVPSQQVFRNLIVHHVSGDGIRLTHASTQADIYDNVVYEVARGIRINQPLTGGFPNRIFNNTVYSCNSLSGQPSGINARNTGGDTYFNVTLRNNIAYGDVNGDFGFPGAPDINAASSHNLSSDASATAHSPAGGTQPNVGLTCPPAPCVSFVSTTAGSENLHLQNNSQAIDRAADLSASFRQDIDGAIRSGIWDIGADEFGATTAVRLMSFEAVPGDGAVDLAWRTGSELSNLGFHIYRGASAEGPWTPLTSLLIPGLGSSPLGQAYAFRDSGLVNGIRYFYRLEDVDTSSVSTFHGPVSAVPTAFSNPGGGSGDGSGSGGGRGSGTGSCPAWVLAAYAPAAGGSSSSLRCTRHGDPDSVSLEVLSRSSRGATLELETGGFYALHEPSGTVRVFVPGFDSSSDPKAPALPLRRVLLDAVVGKKARLLSAEPLELHGFKGLRPSAVGLAEMKLSWDGTVRPARRPLAPPRVSRGYLPRYLARLADSVFQGETKSAVVEISPVRFDGDRRELVLARRVRVRLGFSGRQPDETGSGSTGRLSRNPTPIRETLAQLHTSRRGLHAVSFDNLFPLRRVGIAVGLLRLQRQGQPVPFRVEPATGVFGPASTLYFFADRAAASTDYSPEVAWELVRSTKGQPMGIVVARPEGPSLVSSSSAYASFEMNRIYQPGLLDAPDPWLWQAAVAGAASPPALSLSLAGLDTASVANARLVVSLQGGSDSGTTVDHHLRVSLNGSLVGETSFTGKRPHRLDVPVSPSLLRAGTNELALTNVGDTGVASLVFLDRVTLAFPQIASLRGGIFEGSWAEAGTAEVAGLSSPPLVLDVTLAAAGDGGASSDVKGAVKWLLGAETVGGSVRFQAAAAHRYLVVSRDGLLSPRITRPAPSSLRDPQNQADYLLVAPRDFMDAAQPLLERRQSQGLSAMAVPFEEIAEAFGYGQPSAEAIRSFVSYAFHSWTRPSPRYVLLLGDSTYDPQHFLSTSFDSPLPALWTKTSYLWTVSDPSLAAVNGNDALPDLAIGRLPATTPEEAQRLVSKLLAWEDSGQSLDGKTALVADNRDEAGDFEADVEDIAQSFLATRPTELLKLSELGAQTRPAILEAFNDGLSLMSYVGHGGAAVWASENVWNSWDVPSLQAQSHQPLLITLDCLNGYFVAANFDSLSEALLKAEGRGAIASVSPSGLSLDGPAHLYHRAVMAEITSGTHERLGDVLLAAQKAYAQTGAMPELLAVYQLLGDPAARIR